MTSIPSLSIIIPNYNYAVFLDERFSSILAQGMEDSEIIFLDDASIDNSVAFARQHYGHCITHIEVNECNSGNPFVQWNRGIRRARGEFVWIAEADDFSAPEFLHRMLAAIRQSPAIGMAYCTTVPIDTTGRILDAGFHQRYLQDLDAERWNKDFVATGRDELRHFLARKNTITNVSGVIFRREAYVNAGYAPENLRMCGDWLTYCRILRDWDVAFVSAPMNFHRQHPAKHTQNSVLDLTYFREFLQVQDYVTQVCELDKDDLEAAFRRFLSEWGRLTVSNYGRINLPSTMMLARMAVASYGRPHQQVRIASQLALNASKSLAAKWLLL